MSYSPKSVFHNLRQFVKGPLPPLVPTTLTFRPIDPVKTSPELPKEILDFAEKAGLAPEYIEKIFKKPAQDDLPAYPCKCGHPELHQTFACPMLDPLNALAKSSSSVSKYVEANKLSQAYYEQKIAWEEAKFKDEEKIQKNYLDHGLFGSPLGGPYGGPI